MTETKTIEIHISEIFKWIALIIFLAVLAWWVLGDSPTTEILGLMFTLVGIVLSWFGAEDIKIIKANTFKILEKVEKIDERIK